MLAQFLFVQTQGELAVLLLGAAYLLPAVLLSIGAMSRKPPQQQGSALILFWVLAPISLIPAGSAIAQGDKRGFGVLAVALVSIAAPLLLKRRAELKMKSRDDLHRESEGLTSSISTTRSGGGNGDDECIPKLVSDGAPLSEQVGPMTVGRLAWYFCIGNRYDLELSVRISATNESATGFALAHGYVSPFYSLRSTRRLATVTATGTVSCRKCLPLGTPEPDASQIDADFVASASVKLGESQQQDICTLEVTAHASIDGTSGFSGVSIGPVNLSTPKTVAKGPTKSKAFHFTCVRAKGSANQ